MRKKKLGGVYAGSLALVLLATANASAALIDTTPMANNSIAYFGENDTTTYGQTFRTPDAVNTRLDSFSFFLDHASGGTQSFRSYVFRWNEGLGQITGPALFTSGIHTLSPDSGTNFIEFANPTGGINLTAGLDYVAFFSTAGLFDGIQDKSFWRSVSGSDAYAGGHFVFDNSNGSFPSPGTTWNCGTGCSYQGTGSDLSFRMSFSSPSSVPEPGVLSLLGLGLLAFVGKRRDR